MIFPFFLLEERKDLTVQKQIGDDNGDDNGDDKRILLLLEKEPDITAKKISEKTGFSTRKVSRIIKRLREAEKIIRVGSDRKGYWKLN